jgi:hypothetical protein
MMFSKLNPKLELNNFSMRRQQDAFPGFPPFDIQSFFKRRLHHLQCSYSALSSPTKMHVVSAAIFIRKEVRRVLASNWEIN